MRSAERALESLSAPPPPKPVLHCDPETTNPRVCDLSGGEAAACRRCDLLFQAAVSSEEKKNHVFTGFSSLEIISKVISLEGERQFSFTIIVCL